MLTGLPALESIDWNKLHHAYGRATDTPQHLRALLKKDPEAREEAMEHLWHAVLRQETLYTATGPAARVIVGLLSDPEIDRGESIRGDLMAFLVGVTTALERIGLRMEELQQIAASHIEPLLDSEDGEVLYENDDAEQSFHARAALGCIEAAPALMSVMQEGMSHPLPRIRAYAAMAAVNLTKTASLCYDPKPIESRVSTLAEAATDTDERCAHVLALGDLGCAATELANDPLLKVRMCAALVPGRANDPEAIRSLIHLLETHAGEIDGWFAERPPQFAEHPRFSVVQRLIEQVRDFDRLANAAVAVARMTRKYCVDSEWGPLLTAAFSKGDGIIETNAQREFLRALVANEPLWDRSFGNAQYWFKRSGLPYDRNECARRVLQGS